MSNYWHLLDPGISNKCPEVVLTYPEVNCGFPEMDLT